jgi:condensin complex subunit 1
LPYYHVSQEKQAENIVEKLCQRFRLSEDPRQWRDIAFCLSLLPFKSERSVKKLIEGFQFYRDKLHEPQVYEKFTEILVKVRLLPVFQAVSSTDKHFFLQARSNKSKDKPDNELNEFEEVCSDRSLFVTSLTVDD